jgi:hypothetical protein
MGDFLTKEQAEAFAALLEGVAFQDRDYAWNVSYDDGNNCSTFQECLEALADERDFDLVPYDKQPDTVYLIEKAWADSMENHPLYAFGYKAVGFVATEDEAKAIVGAGGSAPECWATPKDALAYRYTAVPAFKAEAKT